jgi:integrase
MAKIHSEARANGKYYRLRVDVGGHAFRLSLGYDIDPKVRAKLESICTKLESLHLVGEGPDPRFQAILNDCDEELLAKFSDIGLLPKPAPKLEAFLEAYISSRASLKEFTTYKMRNTAKLLVSFFGDVKIASITAGDASDYVQSRKLAGRAPATIGAEVKHGKQFFGYAVKKKFVAENPFEGETVLSQVDVKRRQILCREMLKKVINSDPSLEWRLFLNIVRWTGCRQGEALQLKWTDIRWEDQKIYMPSPKTAHLNKDHRIIPLFSELAPILKEARSSAPQSEKYVVTKLVESDQRSGRLGKNLRKPFQAIIKLAGFDPWAKPFQNLRVTRENELEREYPSHVVQEWIGHTRAVATKHYLSVSTEDFTKACGPSGQIVVSKGPQTPEDRAELQLAIDNAIELQGPAAQCTTVQKTSAPPAGEPFITKKTLIAYQMLAQWSGSGQKLSLEELARQIVEKIEKPASD